MNTAMVETRYEAYLVIAASAQAVGKANSAVRIMERARAIRVIETTNTGRES
jgi:hypothetical protein